MAVKMSAQTVKHTDLLGVFIRTLEAAKASFVDMAHAYRDCVEAGMDMSPSALRHLGVSAGLVFRLSKLAEGKLLEDGANRLLLAADATVQTLTTLPIDTQKLLFKDGVKIWRDGSEQVVPVEEVRPSEAHRMVDTTGGRSRLLTAEEQAARLEPRTPKHDQLVELRLTPEQYRHATYEARKAGWSVPIWVMTELLLAGSLPKQKRTRRADSAAEASVPVLSS